MFVGFPIARCNLACQTEHKEGTMAVTQHSRHQLFKRLEKVLGMEDAGTLLDLLPPVGWSDVATKQDLDRLGAATKRDIDELRVATKRDMDLLRRELMVDLKELKSDLELTSKLRALVFALAAFFLTVVGLLIAASHLI